MTDDEKAKTRRVAAAYAHICCNIRPEDVNADTLALTVVELAERSNKHYDQIQELNARIDRCENEHTHSHQLEDLLVGLKIALHDALDLAEKYMMPRPLLEVLKDYLTLRDTRKWAGERPSKDDVA